MVWKWHHSFYTETLHTNWLGPKQRHKRALHFVRIFKQYIQFISLAFWRREIDHLILNRLHQPYNSTWKAVVFCYESPWSLCEVKYVCVCACETFKTPWDVFARSVTRQQGLQSFLHSTSLYSLPCFKSLSPHFNLFPHPQVCVCFPPDSRPWCDG